MLKVSNIVHIWTVLIARPDRSLLYQFGATLKYFTCIGVSVIHPYRRNLYTSLAPKPFNSITLMLEFEQETSGYNIFLFVYVENNSVFSVLT